MCFFNVLSYSLFHVSAAALAALGAEGSESSNAISNDLSFIDGL